MADAVQVKFEADIRDLKNGLNQVSAGLKKLQNQSANTTKQIVKQNATMTASFNALKSSIVKVGFVVGAAAAAFNAFRAGVNIASDIQKVNLQLSAVTNSAEEFARASQLAYKVAQATGTGFSETATVLTRFTFALKESGGTIEDAAIVADSLNKALLVTGATGAEATSVLTQISQALTKGELNGDEFRSLSENAGVFLDILAESLGVTKSELKELGAQGKITTQDIVDAARLAQERLTKLTESATLPLDRQLTQSLNTIKKALLENNEFPKLVKSIGDGVIALINGFSQLASIAAPVIGALVQVFAALAKVIGAVVSSYAAWVAVLGAAAVLRGAAALEAMVAGFVALGGAIVKATIAMSAFVLANPILAALSVIITAGIALWQRYTDEQKKAAAALKAYRDEAEDTARAVSGITAAQVSELTPILAKRIEIIAKIEEEKKKIAELKAENTAANALLIIQLSNGLNRYDAILANLKEQENVITRIAQKRAADVAWLRLNSNVSKDILAQRDAYRELLTPLTEVQKTKKLIAEKTAALGGEGKVSSARKAEFEQLLALAAKVDAAAKSSKAPKLEITREDNRAVEDYAEALDGLRATWLSLADEQARAKAEQLDFNVQLALYEEAAKKAGVAIDETLVAALRRLNEERQKAEDQRLTDEWLEATQVLTEAQKEAKAFADEIQRIRDAGTKAGKTAEEIEEAIRLYKEWTAAVKEQSEAEKKAAEEREQAIQTFKEGADILANGIGSIFEAVLDKSKKTSDALRELLKQILIFLAQKAILSAFGLPGGFGSFGASASASSSSVRVFNYSGSPATARIRSDGSIDVNINALAGAIAKGGNSFDAAIRRTYGLQRQGR